MQKKLPLLFLCALLALWSCNKDDDPTPSIEFPSEIVSGGVNLSSGSQASQTVTFKANKEWKATIAATKASDLSWVHVHPDQGGAGEVSITISADANETPDSREAQINIEIDGLTKSFTVKQAQKDALVLSEHNVTVPVGGGEFDVTLESNVAVTAEIPSEYAGWLSQVPSGKAMTSTTFKFKAEAYDGYEDRVGKIIVKDNSSTLTDTVYVTQKTSIVLPSVYVKNAGGLDAALTAATTQRDTITQLILLGNLNSADFEIIRNDLLELKSIDFSQCSLQDNAIPDNAFNNFLAPLTTVAWPQNIVKIGDNAFNGCTKITGELKIPATVTYIGVNAFRSCKFTGDWSTMIPAGVTFIGTGAFYGQSKITGELKLPEGITEIPADEFYGCSGIKGVLKIPAKVTKIGSQAFSSCSGLTGTLELPATVKEIGNKTFFNAKFTGLILHEGLEVIGEWAFWQCSAIQGKLVIPNTVTILGAYAFRACSGLTGVQLSENLTEIGQMAFQDCKNLTGELVLPSKQLKLIGQNAFLSTQLTGKLVIPACLDSIGGSAFQGNKFSALEFAPGCKLRSLDRTFVYNENLSGAVVLPESITLLRGTVFERSRITSVTLPSGLQYLGQDVFWDCDYLTKIISKATVPPVVIKSTNYIYDRIPADSWYLGYAPEGILQVEASSVDAYKQAKCWGELPVVAIGSTGDSDVSIDDMTNSDGSWKK